MLCYGLFRIKVVLFWCFMDNLTSLQKELFYLQDLKYRAFHIPLMPTVNEQRVIGIRTPVLRKFANEFYKRENYKEFLKTLPHYYYEENNLHAFLIEKCEDYDLCISLLDEFLPYVDNWATCDMLNPKVLLKNRKRLEKDLMRFLKSPHVYVKRFGIVCAMRAYIGENYNEEIANKIASIQSAEYYVNSAIGWFFATLLTKNYNQSVRFIQEKRLNEIAHNLAIKKARESLCIEKDKKEYLKTLKI